MQRKVAFEYSTKAYPDIFNQSNQDVFVPDATSAEGLVEVIAEGLKQRYPLYNEIRNLRLIDE